MMRPSVQGVDPPVCCVLDVTVTYARDSFVDCQAGPFVLSRGGPGILDVTVTYARDSFVDSQAGPFVLSRGGGPRYPGCYCYICKRQFCGFTGWAFCPLEGGGGAQISWHQSYICLSRRLQHVIKIILTKT